MSPFGATTTLVGSVRAVGGSPATPALPSVRSTVPSGLNLTTVWPLPVSPGNFFFSRSLIPRASATQTFPSRSAWILCGKINIPAPKDMSSLPDESNFMTGATVEPAQLSYGNADSPGRTSGFAPQRLTIHTDSPSLSMSTPFSAPQVCPAGRVPQGAVVL